MHGRGKTHTKYTYSNVMYFREFCVEFRSGPSRGGGEQEEKKSTNNLKLKN